jgi:hypothetical protein
MRTLSPKTAAEQRQHPRVALGVTLDLRLSGEGPTRCRGTISDLSRGGMSFSTDAVLEKGMTLHLKLPTALEIRGEIRSASGPAAGPKRYGVRFHKVGYYQSVN